MQYIVLKYFKIFLQGEFPAFQKYPKSLIHRGIWLEPR